MQERRLPRGFHFRPTDEILVGHFLYKKITGSLPQSDQIYVPECDLYGKEEPWQIWEKSRRKDDFEEDLCFFTGLKKKAANSNGSRIDRSTGSSGGCWHGEDSGSKVNADDYIRQEHYTATKKRFSYRNKGSNHGVLWIMHEYSLQLAGENKSKSSNWVLCRLRKKGGKDKRKSTAPVPLEDPVIDDSNTSSRDIHPSKKSRTLQKHAEIEASVRVEKEEPMLQTVFIIEDDEDECLESDKIHHQTDAGLRVEQEQPNSLEGDSDKCLISDIIHHQTEACLRVEQERSKVNGVLSATEYLHVEKVGLCDPGDEFSNDAACYFGDKFDDLRPGLTSLELDEIFDVPSLNSETIAPCNQEIEADLGAAPYEEKCLPIDDVGLCDPGDEFFNDAVCYFGDKFHDLLPGLTSLNLEKFLDVSSLNSETISPCNQETEAGLGAVPPLNNETISPCNQNIEAGLGAVLLLNSETISPCNQEIEAALGAAQVPKVHIHRKMESTCMSNYNEGATGEFSDLVPAEIRDGRILSWLRLPGQLEDD